MLSGSSVRVICSIRCQVSRYSPISWMPIVPWMSVAHWCACRPSATVQALRRRLGTQAYRCGVISEIERPSIHLSSQKRVRWPLPTIVLVEAKKKSRSSFVNCKPRPLHALLLSVRLSHCQRVRRARPVRSRSWDCQAAERDRPAYSAPVYVAMFLLEYRYNQHEPRNTNQKKILVLS